MLSVKATVRGELGEMRVTNPILPHLYHKLNVSIGGQNRSQRIRGHTTYAYQLQAFVQAVRAGKPPLTGPDDAVANMKVIDDIYTAAGLPLRGA